jgi:thiamine-monophosphate kinase
MSRIDENKIVRLIRKRFGAQSAAIVQGIGDDAAVLHPCGAAEYWVVTTDVLLEEIDFRRTWLTPAQLGHKSLAVNLSDLAAMGSRPRFFTVALALPADIEKRWIENFYRGSSALAARHGAILIGGDLSRSPSGIQIAITAIGDTFNRRPIYRSGGRPGDFLYVTGVLGQAAAGLALMQQDRVRGRTASEREALRSHRLPEPRCDVGAWLARNCFASCMMDLSDGMSMDLPRLCEASGVGAEISGARLPVFAHARRWQCDPVQLALHGGEDFELLFAVPLRKARHFEEAYPPGFPPISRVGYLRKQHGVIWIPETGAKPRRLIPAGFDHFRS